ncbi:type 1 fimbria pilin [Variovorax boronicumulans]|uniref:fimbrial protein n=1 Tax=Variovorax boronicumulans TaxID=436515 RepID=UPI0024748D5B|nr:fimbrial protein [Variovorax boronicumulans]MDH6170656.1 type 1 fimbria pilin [Variovorax boronicumulans]
MNRSHPFRAMKTARRSVRFAAPAVALWLGTQSAWAACTVTPGYIEKTVDMAMGRVIIPNDAAVGTMFKSQLFPIPSSTAINKPWTCEGGGNVKGVMLQGTEVPGYDHVFTTTVPGVGIRLSRYFNESSVNYYPHDRSTQRDFGDFNASSRFQVELFKIAAVTGNGPLAQGTYTRYYSVADNKSVLTTNLLGNGITILTPSCTVDLGSKNILVDFGKVPQSNFKGKGTTTGDRKFNIKLNCKAGQNAQNTVLLRMDATRDLSTNEKGVLKLTQAGSRMATGVGIQVVSDKSGRPVNFNTGVLDEMEQVGPSMTGPYVLPYTARYFQTGDKVTPGRANGTATFTLDYK